MSIDEQLAELQEMIDKRNTALEDLSRRMAELKEEMGHSLQGLSFSIEDVLSSVSSLKDHSKDV